MKLTSYKAIKFAEANNLTLNMYTSPIAEARDGLSVEEARKIAHEDDSLIWLETDLRYYSVFPVADEECNSINDDNLLLRTTDIEQALEAARRAPYPFGAAIVDELTGAIDFGTGFKTDAE